MLNLRDWSVFYTAPEVKNKLVAKLEIISINLRYDVCYKSYVVGASTIFALRKQNLLILLKQYVQHHIYIILYEDVDI